MRMSLKWIVSLALLATGGCSGPASSPSGLPMTAMTIGSRTYQLEIAADDASREHGLMERDELNSDHGMIFVFPKSSVENFWMKNTRFPLEIIYADDHAKILSTDTMKAYDQNTPHESAGPAKYAIELSVGELASNGVKPGDTLTIPPAVAAVKVN